MIAVAVIGSCCTAASAEETIAYASEPVSGGAEDGILIVPPGAMQLNDPQAVLMAQGEAPIVVEQQLFANGLVVPTGYQCPSEGHCMTPCLACRQAQYAGWSVDVDFLLFRAYWAGGPSTIVHDKNEGDSTLGLRLTVGHENASGGGVEFRLGGASFDEIRTINFDQSNAVIPGGDLQTFQFDFDLTQRVWIGDSSIVLGVGPRAAVLMRQFGADPERQLNAGGLGISATLYRPFWRSNKTQFAAIGFGRGSIMGGEVLDAADRVVADGTLSILEAGFGLEMRRQCGRGDFVGRVLFESQWWESNVMQPIYLDGASFRVGYQW